MKGRGSGERLAVAWLGPWLWLWLWLCVAADLPWAGILCFRLQCRHRAPRGRESGDRLVEAILRLLALRRYLCVGKRKEEGGREGVSGMWLCVAAAAAAAAALMVPAPSPPP